MIGVLFSGGKDSTLTSFIMESLGFEVVLISFFPKNKDSYMLHSNNLEIAEFLAKAMNKKIFKFEVSGEKENEVMEMQKHIEKLNLNGLASGAISSEYQKQRIELIGENLGIPTYSPLWHKKLLRDYEKMDIIISKVSAYGLGKEDLGKNAIPYLEKYNYFEGGDAETLVLDAPFFNKKIEIKYEKEWNKYHGKLIIKKVKLINK